LDLIANIKLSSPLIVSITLVWLVLVSTIVYLTLRARITRKELAASESDLSQITKGKKQVLDFLHHLGLSIQEDQSAEKLHEVIVNGVSKITHAQGGALYLLDDTGNNLFPAYISDDCAQLTIDAEKTGIQLDQNINKMTFKVVISSKKGILGEAFNSQKAIFTDNLKEHSSFSNDYTGSGSAMVIPLIHAQKAIGVLAVTRSLDQPKFDSDSHYTFSKVAQQSAFALGNQYAHAQMAEKRFLEEELLNANQVQALLLPSESPVLDNFELFGYNLAAKQVSGDYYDYISLPNNQTGVVIADVSGKGVAAGLIMATFRSALRALANNHPAKSLSQLNRIIYPDIRDDMFISAIYANLNNDSGMVTLARAGHNKLFLYTDGIIEALDKYENQFTPERLEKTLLEYGGSPAKELGNKVLQAVTKFVRKAPTSDDITLVVIERK